MSFHIAQMKLKLIDYNYGKKHATFILKKTTLFSEFSKNYPYSANITLLVEAFVIYLSIYAAIHN